MRRRIITLIIAFCAGWALYYTARGASFRSLSNKQHGPTEYELSTGTNILPDLRSLKVNRTRLPKGLVYADDEDISTSFYPVGKTKPPGSTYLKTLVIASTRDENTTWVGPELADMIDDGLLKTAVYVVDDKNAKLRPPKNKGHEAMVYLTYIIDHYDDLADVSIFMHAHQNTWHNNELLDFDAAMMVRALSSERVLRQGYMNLRCGWDPGCPEWIRPGTVVLDDDKQEEAIIANHWQQLFPDEPIPRVLAQACCAQFAVSRDRILALPKQRYITMRQWLLDTRLDDYLSGRIFEYTWQFIFAKKAIDCPNMRACYCDGYGICFGSERKFNHWYELSYWLGEDKFALKKWWEMDDLIKQYRKNSRDGRVSNLNAAMIPEPGLDGILEANITANWRQMKQMRSAAIELGKDPRQRALEAGRVWKEGDGY